MIDRVANHNLSPVLIATISAWFANLTGDYVISGIGFCISGGWLALGYAKHRLAREQFEYHKTKGK